MRANPFFQPRALLAVMLGAYTLTAFAENQPFAINAQPLQDALLQYSEVTGKQVFFSSELAKNLRGNAVKGRYTDEQALQQLLSETGLAYRVTGANSITLVQARVNTQEQNTTPTKLPVVNVVDSAIYDSTDPHNTDYNRPNAISATKTDTPILETPANIQVIPQQVLKDQQVIRIEEALQNASGIYKQQAESAEAFNIRGFNTFEYYRNGVRNQSALTQAGDRETANLERIEVLKGPAAILYGRIEPGGLINLVTKQPLEQSYHAFQQQLGNFDLYRTTIDSTGPLTDTNELLYRVNIAYENKGSFREFVTNDRVFVAPVLKWNISDRTQATFEVEYKHARESTDFGIPAQGNRPINIPRERNLGEDFTFSESDETLAGINWSHEFNDNWKVQHKFNSILTNENDDVVIGTGGVDLDSTTFSRSYTGFRNNETQTYSNNLDLTGHFKTYGLEHTLLLGGDSYLFKNTGLIVDNFNFPSIDILNPVHSGAPVRDPNDDFFFDTTEEWYGFYLQDQIKLPYDLSLLAGFRYDNAVITYKNSFGTNRRADDKATPRFGLLWHPLPELSVYGNYVENFGIPNAFAFGASGSNLGPETAKQFEAGIKTEFFDGRLSTTLAWYQLTKQNIAISSPNPALAVLGVSELVGEARNTGIEFDISGEIVKGWNIIASYSHIDSTITRQTDGTQSNRFNNVPEHGGSLWNTYQLQSGALQGLKFGAGLVARSQREGNNQNDFQLPGYALVNLLASYEFKVGKSRIITQLNVDNLLDKTYFPSSLGFGRSRIDFGAPRTVIGSVRVEF